MVNGIVDKVEHIHGGLELAAVTLLTMSVPSETCRLLVVGLLDLLKVKVGNLVWKRGVILVKAPLLLVKFTLVMLVLVIAKTTFKPFLMAMVEFWLIMVAVLLDSLVEHPEAHWHLDEDEHEGRG